MSRAGRALTRSGWTIAAAGTLFAVAALPAMGQTGSAGGGVSGTPDPLSWGQMQQALRQRPAAETAPVRIAYGSESEQYGELTVPGGEGPFPLALVIHGGCWQSIADVSYMRPFAEALAGEGWAVWSLEFRRIDQPGGAWPGILEDVQAGAAHARSLADRYPLDLSRIAAFGHSSGGHLALWLAAQDALEIDAVVSLAGIADLEDYRRYTRCGPRAVDGFLGADPDSPEGRSRMETSDPAVLPTSARRLLLMGELDPIVPPAHAHAFRDRVAPEGASNEVSVQVVTVESAGHFELVAPWVEVWPEVWNAITSFVAASGGY